MDEIRNIEEARERVAGLEHEEGRRVRAMWDYEVDEAEAYDLADPKHPDHYDVWADYGDAA